MDGMAGGGKGREKGEKGINLAKSRWSSFVMAGMAEVGEEREKRGKEREREESDQVSAAVVGK